MRLKPAILAALALLLTACATTTPNPAPDTGVAVAETPNLENAPIAHPEPEGVPAPTSVPVIVADGSPAQDQTLPPPMASAYADLPLWETANPLPALKSFRATCGVWAKRDDDAWIRTGDPMFGQYKDWRTACTAAEKTALNRVSAITFFQSFFEPVPTKGGGKPGLLTGYYAPQIDVRRKADAEFSEPILARPTSAKTQSLPRKDLNAFSSKVLAYGRPIEVFFLHVQGSGQMHFEDGSVFRVAFDGHNGHKYKSIGKLMIARGYMHKDKAGMEAIAAWMAKAGPKAARDLINENPRYVFFKSEYIVGDEGPKGAMRVPLTAMGSMAVDPAYMPYGALVWLNVKLPQYPGDYIAKPSGVLVSTQDTGGAIKGEHRGDLYFGAGDEAGDLAGVMKHKAVWTLLLPVPLAWRLAPVS